MNSSIVARRSNNRFFFTAVALSIGLAVASGFFIHGMFGGGENGAVEASKKSCLAVLRSNGFNPVIKDDTLKIAYITERNLEGFVYKSGVIIASCPAYTLKAYCAGVGCPNPGISFILKQKEQ